MDDRRRVVRCHTRNYRRVCIAQIVDITALNLASMIAQHIAQSAPQKKTLIIDAFAGVGGNTIAFAKSGRWDRVFAIEKDPVTLACAKHNAEIYGVQDLITWYEGDCFEVVKSQMTEVGEHAVLFASPPWGGPSSST